MPTRVSETLEDGDRYIVWVSSRVGHHSAAAEEERVEEAEAALLEARRALRRTVAINLSREPVWGTGTPRSSSQALRSESDQDW